MIHHKFTGDTSCAAGKAYVKTLYTREEEDIKSLAALTGWTTEQIRKQVPGHEAPPVPAQPPSWWEQQ